MGGFLGIGGSARKTDRKFQIDAMGKMKNVFNYGIDMMKDSKATGDATTASGMEGLDKAGGYWNSILSGNRTAVNAAIAPETNAINAGADATKRQIATSGTARGGGVNSTNQQVNSNTRAATDNAIFSARPKAAIGAADVGSKKAAVGLSELEQAMQALGISGKTATDLASISSESRKTSQAINQQVVGQWTDLVSNVAKAAFA